MTKTEHYILTVTTFFVALVSTSCYKPRHIPIPAGKPTYTMGIEGVSLSNGTTVFTIKKSYKLVFYMRFTLISGDPTNYPLSLSFTGIPAGVTGFGNAPTVFKLNEYMMFYISSAAPSGIYPFLINISTPDDTVVQKANLVIE